MTPVSHGKPCTGNPHARFDEGASASEEPRRKALLHIKPAVTYACIFAALAAAAGETRINAIGEKSRGDIVRFFTDNEFGRRPTAVDKAEVSFEKMSEDRLMPDGKMVRRQSRVVYKGPYGTKSFPVTACDMQPVTIEHATMLIAAIISLLWSRAFRLGVSGAEAPSSNRACGFPAHGFPCETGVIGISFL